MLQINHWSVADHELSALFILFDGLLVVSETFACSSSACSDSCTLFQSSFYARSTRQLFSLDLSPVYGVFKTSANENIIYRIVSIHFKKI